MFDEFEKVKILSNGKTGIIVDKTMRAGKAVYIVEDDEYVDDEYPLYDCVDEDLMRVAV